MALEYDAVHWLFGLLYRHEGNADLSERIGSLCDKADVILCCLFFTRHFVTESNAKCILKTILK